MRLATADYILVVIQITMRIQEFFNGIFTISADICGLRVLVIIIISINIDRFFNLKNT